MSNTNINQLEFKEFLYSQTLMAATLTRLGHIPVEPVKARDTMREILRLHRFDVITWLMEHGAQIPVALVADGVHPEVGKQSPDCPVLEQSQNIEP